MWAVISSSWKKTQTKLKNLICISIANQVLEGWKKITWMVFMVWAADYTWSKILYSWYKVWTLYDFICVIKVFPKGRIKQAISRISFSLKNGSIITTALNARLTTRVHWHCLAMQPFIEKWVFLAVYFFYLYIYDESFIVATPSLDSTTSPGYWVLGIVI